MLPVFLIVGINAGIDPTLLAFIMIGTNAYGGSVTHYGAAPGPIIFSAGYNNVKDWWTVGSHFRRCMFSIELRNRYPLVENHWFHVI